MNPSLVLIPGLNNTHAVFDGVVSALPPSIDPLALDNPPLDSVEAIAHALLPRLPPRFWLAGFSFGGYVSLAMLELAPERIAGLALLCTSPFADSPAASDKRRAALEAVASGHYLEWVEAQVANTFHPESLNNTALMAMRRKMLLDYGPHAYAAHVRATMTRVDRRHLLDGRHPTLVLAASNDRLFPPESMASLAQGIAGARFGLVQHAGHLMPLEQPAEVARLLSDWMISAASSSSP